ncbi:hypothetical protein LAZ40_12675 [Cereibacter sphaeroides]|uniref:molybdopterin dinucleotide binding domain-containing protein n=1 Tax=Cereibacter sphaeroides TaxID=1063 RepID=UPI001F1D74BA|nr:molybdopterin dinucleotide binding domain-containing protein [Cereibacter sphaeroides]MCE6959878.1 hypothetical protein [Cereibacter sphaeroides]MCE6968655.1 hypothetical protein [Cereibacter sphaeroides]MCE6974732.1 hypothetical protein [Cereibacter sphaeroides]
MARASGAGKGAAEGGLRYLINNGRSNIHWQNWFLDKGDDFVFDRFPFPFLEIHPDDMAELGLKPGDLVEIWNDVGATQAMACPTPTARPGETFMVFGAPSGTQGNVINAGTNELVLPNCKQTRANIRKISDPPASVRHLTFKSQEVELG